MLTKNAVFVPLWASALSPKAKCFFYYRRDITLLSALRLDGAAVFLFL
jgi:hypothetical protein